MMPIQIYKDVLELQHSSISQRFVYTLKIDCLELIVH